MSFNQHTGHQNLSNETSNSQTRGGRVSNNGQQVSDASIGNSNHNLYRGLIPVAHGFDYEDSGIQYSSTQTPTTRQPPTLPSIAATAGEPFYPGPFTLGTPHSINNKKTPAPRSKTQAHTSGDPWMPRSDNNVVVPLNRLQLPSTHLRYNSNYPWNDNRAAVPHDPHPVVSATVHPAAAGYRPSTFTPGSVSARNWELMDVSTPLEPSRRHSATPNPLGAVGDYHPAYSRYYVTKFESFTARHQARISNAQTEDARLDTNGESDSVGVDTPDSDDEAELYDSSVRGDGPGMEDEGKEQDTGAYEEVVESEEKLTNGLNAER